MTQMRSLIRTETDTAVELDPTALPFAPLAMPKQKIEHAPGAVLRRLLRLPLALRAKIEN